MHILHVVGARPNFIKVAPVMAVLGRRDGIGQTLVHTGQHYDAGMSEVFFQQLGLSEPDVNLEVGSGSHARQTGEIMARFEPVMLRQKPDLVLVYGDVNSTVAAALVCAKLLIPVGHVEAGLRSFDRTMPEEINRLLTDQISDLLFTPSADGDANLLREGVAVEKIHRVGNVMIDTLVRLLETAKASTLLDQLGLRSEIHRSRDELVGGKERSSTPAETRNTYGLVTLHRPSNVDDPAVFSGIMKTLMHLSRMVPLIFPVHPRTRKLIETLDLHSSGLRLLEPLGYLDFLALEGSAAFVITDSGGIQEETTYLGVPCLTVRENTERPVTVTDGTNILVGLDMNKLCHEVDRILSGEPKKGRVPVLWDGRAAERIADVITNQKASGHQLVDVG